MYPFMLLCTLYFICTAPENIVVWRFINQWIIIIIIKIKCIIIKILFSMIVAVLFNNVVTPVMTYIPIR